MYNLHVRFKFILYRDCQTQRERNILYTVKVSVARYRFDLHPAPRNRGKIRQRPAAGSAHRHGMMIVTGLCVRR